MVNVLPFQKVLSTGFLTIFSLIIALRTLGIIGKLLSNDIMRTRKTIVRRKKVLVKQKRKLKSMRKKKKRR